jgi:hypothetical protein
LRHPHSTTRATSYHVCATLIARRCVGGAANVIASGVRARSDTAEHMSRAVAQPSWLATRAKPGVRIR